MADHSKTISRFLEPICQDRLREARVVMGISRASVGIGGTGFVPLALRSH
jgi:hypothetical protein